MATGPRGNEERAATEAADWLLALEDEPDDPALQERFAAWLAADPANKAAWSETALAYDLIGPAAAPSGATIRPFEAKAIADDLLARAPPAGLAYLRVPANHRVVAGAAGALLAACVALIIVPGLLLQLQADYATGTAEQRTIHLADGSTVRLAAKSAIAVEKSGTTRQVRLLAGRAFFDVKHDARSPFVVLTRGVRTTDIGTAFAVWMEDDGAGVAVAHGAVQVDYDGPSAVHDRLAPGQWVRIPWKSQVERGDVPVANIAAWRRSELVSSNRPVAEVVEQLRPYFAGLIVLTNDDFAARRVTGVYNLRDPAGALQALAQARPGVTVHRITPWLLVVSGS